MQGREAPRRRRRLPHGVLRRLEADMASFALEAWIRPLDVRVEEGRLQLRCPTAFHRDRVRDQLLERVVKAAEAEAGRAIFCEKPISLDVAEVDRALAAVEAAGVPLHIGFNRRFDPSHKAVADAVADGSIGDVEVVNITSRDPAPPPIAYIEVSGGIFNDMAIHDFDMARFVTGSEVESVYALGRVRVDPAIGQAGDVDTAVIVLTHENGCLTTIDISRRAVYGYDQRVEAFGSGGMAQSTNHHDANAVVATAGGYRQPPLQNFFLERYTASYLDQWEAFVAAVENGTPTPISGADGRAPLVIGMAAKRSMDEGRPVLITEII